MARNCFHVPWRRAEHVSDVLTRTQRRKEWHRRIVSDGRAVCVKIRKRCVKKLEATVERQPRKNAGNSYNAWIGTPEMDDDDREGKRWIVIGWRTLCVKNGAYVECGDEICERVCETAMWAADSQRNMRSVCWRPLIASSTAAWAGSSCVSASFSEPGGGRRLNLVAHDAARVWLRWPWYVGMRIGGGRKR